MNGEVTGLSVRTQDSPSYFYNVGNVLVNLTLIKMFMFQDAHLISIQFTLSLCKWHTYYTYSYCARRHELMTHKLHK